MPKKLPEDEINNNILSPKSVDKQSTPETTIITKNIRLSSGHKALQMLDDNIDISLLKEIPNIKKFLTIINLDTEQTISLLQFQEACIKIPTWTLSSSIANLQDIIKLKDILGDSFYDIAKHRPKDALELYKKGILNKADFNLIFAQKEGLQFLDNSTLQDILELKDILEDNFYDIAKQRPHEVFELYKNGNLNQADIEKIFGIPTPPLRIRQLLPVRAMLPTFETLVSDRLHEVFDVYAKGLLNDADTQYIAELNYYRQFQDKIKSLGDIIPVRSSLKEEQFYRLASNYLDDVLDLYLTDELSTEDLDASFNIFYTEKKGLIRRPHFYEEFLEKYKNIPEEKFIEIAKHFMTDVIKLYDNGILDLESIQHVLSRCDSYELQTQMKYQPFNFPLDAFLSLYNTTSSNKVFLNEDILFTILKHQPAAEILNLLKANQLPHTPKIYTSLDNDLRGTLLWITQERLNLNEKNELNTFLQKYIKLLKINQPAKEEKHCTITLTIQPLFNSLKERSVLDNSQKDLEYLIDYIKEFGANQMPLIATIYIYLKKGILQEKLLHDIELQQIITESLGTDILTKFSKATDKEILEKLHKLIHELHNSILKDKLDDRFLTTLGTDIFSGLRPDTQWNKSFSVKKLLELQKTVHANNPEAVRPHKEYTTKQYDVLKRGKASDISEEKASISVGNDRIVAHLQPILNNLKNNSLNIAQTIEKFKADSKHIIEKESLHLINRDTSKLPPKAQAGISKRIVMLETLVTKIDKINTTENNENKEAVSVIDQLVSLDREQKLPTQLKSILDQTLLTLSLYPCLNDPNQRLQNQLMPLTNTDLQYNSDNTRKVVEDGIKFFTEYFLTDHIKTYPEQHTRTKLQKLWDQYGVTSLIIRQNELNARNTESLSFVPSKGLLRMISGELGDSCHTAEALRFAQGEYPNITAVAIIQDKQSGIRELTGSFLLIEAETENGEPALVLRANNPRLALLDIVNTDSLMEAIMDYTKDIAAARGIPTENICVPIDLKEDYGASSNRDAVVNYYAKHFNSHSRVGLKRTPDTNFNNYPIYDKEGEYPIVSIKD